MQWAHGERAQLTQAVPTAASYPLTNDAERDALLRDAQLTQSRLKQLKAMKATIVDPLKASIKATGAIFDPAIEAAESIVSTIKDRVLAYNREQTARLAQARQAAQAALTAAIQPTPAPWSPGPAIGPQTAAQACRSPGCALPAQGFYPYCTEHGHAAAPAPTFAPGALAAVAVTSIDIKGIHGTKTYRAVVTDISALPIEYHLPDQKRLDALARESKGAAQLPGVRFEVVESLAIGGAS
jgi:hypothetical protein